MAYLADLISWPLRNLILSATLLRWSNPSNRTNSRLALTMHRQCSYPRPRHIIPSMKTPASSAFNLQDSANEATTRSKYRVKSHGQCQVSQLQVLRLHQCAASHISALYTTLLFNLPFNHWICVLRRSRCSTFWKLVATFAWHANTPGPTECLAPSQSRMGDHQHKGRRERKQQWVRTDRAWRPLGACFPRSASN